MLIIVVAAVLVFPVMRWYARRLERTIDDPVDALHRLRLTSLVFTFVWLLLIGAATLEFQVDRQFVPGMGVAAPVALLVAAALATPIALQLAVRPTYERLRGFEGTTRRVHRRMLRGLAVTLVPQLVWLGLLGGLAQAGVNPIVLVLVLVGYLLFLTTCGPLLVMAAVRTTPADPHTQQIVERLCAELGMRIRGIRVIDTAHNPTANAAFAGFGVGPKYVFVTDRLLADFSDDELTAVLAHEIGHRKRHHIAIKLATRLGTLVLLAACLFAFVALGHGSRPLLIAAAVLLPLVLITAPLLIQGAVGIRLEQQADDYAASVAGAEPLHRALVKLYERNMMKRRTGRFWNLMTQHPGMDNRLQRLSEEPSRSHAAG